MTLTAEEARNLRLQMEAASPDAKAAQQARSKKYHIGIKDGGSITKPGEWSTVPDSEWGDPVNYRYPMPDKSHADNAASRWGDDSNRSQYNDAEQKIIGERIARRQAHFGEKSDGKKEESAATVVSSVTKPRKKIATLPICWLEYNARSLNGRIYPKATCDAIFAAAQRKLADRQALPPTTFVSHEAANGNINTELVGAPVKVWQEGSKFWAYIDLADTRVSWDMLGLAEGGYLKSGSMRVLGVELRYDKGYDLPLVVPQEGVEIDWLGIDLTTRPGLADIARIPQVLYESDGRLNYHDAFLFESLPPQKEQDPPMAIPLYLHVIAGSMTEAMTADRAAHQRVHDHLAGVLDETIKAVHGDKSESLIRDAGLSEEGRAIAKKHATKLAAAHDESAKQLGMDCEGAYNEALGLPLDSDQDGDGIADDEDPADQSDDGEEAARRKGQKIMTEKEMMEALKAKGFNITPPKTAEERLAEMQALIEEQNRKIAALTEGQSGESQRQTQVLGSGAQESQLLPEQLYMEGDYLQGTLSPKNWAALANRRVPWPQDVDPELALHELAPFMAMSLIEREANAMGRSVDQLVGPHEQI